LSRNKAPPNLFARDVKISRDYVLPEKWNGLVFRFVEVNVLNLPHIGEQMNVAYQIIDNRSAPAFFSPVTRLPILKDQNLYELIDQIFQDYEILRVPHFHVQFSESWKKMLAEMAKKK
jgi:hypothetical protein